jgi:hypothetical protein
MARNAARGDRQAPGQLPAARAGRVCARGVRVSQCSSRRLSRGRYCCARDAATLYTIVTLATGQRCTERTGFKSLVICEGAAKQQRQREPLTSKTQISRASPSVGACWGCGPAPSHLPTSFPFSTNARTQQSLGVLSEALSSRFRLAFGERLSVKSRLHRVG